MVAQRLDQVVLAPRVRSQERFGLTEVQQVVSWEQRESNVAAELACLCIAVVHVMRDPAQYRFEHGVLRHRQVVARDELRKLLGAEREELAVLLH